MPRASASTRLRSLTYRRRRASGRPNGGTFGPRPVRAPQRGRRRGRAAAGCRARAAGAPLATSPAQRTQRPAQGQAQSPAWRQRVGHNLPWRVIDGDGVHIIRRLSLKGAPSEGYEGARRYSLEVSKRFYRSLSKALAYSALSMNALGLVGMYCPPGRIIERYAFEPLMIRGGIASATPAKPHTGATAVITIASDCHVDPSSRAPELVDADAPSSRFALLF